MVKYGKGRYTKEEREMATKCPKCGGELIQTTPEIAKCKGCGAAFKRKAPVAKGTSANNVDKENPKQQSKKGTKKSKKKGGILKWLILVIVIALIGAVGYFAWREAEGNLLSEELTISEDFVGETTQEELDDKAKEGYYNSAKLNSDGSVTISMTKSQRRKILKETEKSIQDSLDKMVSSEEYPNFTSIKANKNFTEFTVKTKSEKLDISESFSAMVLYIYGGMYNGLIGEEIDNVSVTFVNDETGNIIDTLNSKDMESGQQSNADTGGGEAEDMLVTIKDWYVGEIWNNFVDFDWYRTTGKDSTGSDIDIEFAFNSFLGSYALKEEYNSYINSLPEEYAELKDVWSKMNEQIELIYQDLNTNGVAQGQPDLNLDLLRQYSERFYELIDG